MRLYFETLEDTLLAPYAIKSADSKGRKYLEPHSETRTCFQRDRDRVIHSKSFRRLKHKTQVFIATNQDHFRTRLTHTIEVAQLSRHIARLLRLNEDLSECIALSHDLGHTPFGHSGETELNSLMKSYGGFEHNQQSKRIIEHLENKYPHFNGLNLSYEVTQGLDKHTSPYDTPKESNDTFVSLEALVGNVADEIAYNNHDLDDGLSSNILDESHLNANVTLWNDAKKAVQAEYTQLDETQLKHLINSHLISNLVKDIYINSTQSIKTLQINSVEMVQNCQNPIISFSKEMDEKNSELRKYLYKHFYHHHNVYRMNKKGQYIIRKLFHAFQNDPALLPDSYFKEISITNDTPRVICDYIAGMTDGFAVKEYESLYL